MFNAFASMLVVTASMVTAIIAAVASQRWRTAHLSTAPQRVPVIGGAEPATHAWSRFHVRYYPMALVFIAFEMEMMFMYPWAVVFVAEGGKAMVEMGMFLSILGIGILYAYREGAFRWQ